MEQEKEIICKELAAEYGISFQGLVSEQEIIEKLALQVGAIAAKGPDAFFQLMYRLDIAEKKLTAAMIDKQAAIEIAKLIYNRQLQKVRSRAYYKKDSNNDDELGW
ncbi:MAG: hypothetical protein J0L80_09585 [Chitinophagales bacterium]|jgi:hypothetical protein|nr:hypothetical protein [Chitinophagales bacterium]